MSSRFHQKYHRYNHHSVSPGEVDDIRYPDAGYDPIASFEHPFQGEFYSQGNIITTLSLSAKQNLGVEINGTFGNDVIVGNDLAVRNNGFIEGNLTVDQNLEVKRDLLIDGNLIVHGDYTILHTNAYVTSSVEVVNVGTSAGLKVTQAGNQPIARFIDFEGGEVTIGNAAVITAPSIVLTNPQTHSTVAYSNTLLPTTAIDVELDATTNVTVTGFSGGVQNIMYTLTNVSTKVITITSFNGSNTYIRNGTAWRSNTYSMSAAYLHLAPNYSCSLRIGKNNIVSLW
jgi:hypothetical protein